MSGIRPLDSCDRAPFGFGAGGGGRAALTVERCDGGFHCASPASRRLGALLEPTDGSGSGQSRALSLPCPSRPRECRIDEEHALRSPWVALQFFLIFCPPSCARLIQAPPLGATLDC